MAIHITLHITRNPTPHITSSPTIHITLHITLHIHSPRHQLHTSNHTTIHIHSPRNHPRNNKNLLALRHSILTNHVAAVSQAHCIVNLERMVERSLEPVKILVLRLAPLNLAER